MEAAFSYQFAFRLAPPSQAFEPKAWSAAEESLPTSGKPPGPQLKNVETLICDRGERIGVPVADTAGLATGHCRIWLICQ